MQNRMEIDGNPDLEFPLPEAEREAESTRASSRPASKKKSTLILTYEEVAKLKGVEFATELFALKEAAEVYHPSPESIVAAMRVIHVTGDPPSESLMRAAGPAFSTWLRDRKGSSRHNFTQWLKIHYPDDFATHKKVGSHGGIAVRPPNPWGVYKRVPPDLNAKFLAEGKRWCPNCTSPKPEVDFYYKTGTRSSQCRDCRRNRSRQNTTQEENA